MNLRPPSITVRASSTRAWLRPFLRFCTWLLLLSAGSWAFASEIEPVRGRLLAADGSPIVGAIVQWLEMRPDTEPISSAEVRSNSTGNFDLETGEAGPEEGVLLIQHPKFEIVSLSLAAGQISAIDGRREFELEASIVEEIQVIGEQIGDRFAPHTLRASAVTIGDRVAPATVAGLAATIPGVSENGQGGLFQVLSIRGISQHRVMTLFAGARITSERRAGVSLSFVEPALLSEVDVERGPATTYYGSGALGGAVQIYPRRFERLSFGTGWEDEGDQANATLGIGTRVFSLGLAGRRSDDRTAADGSQRFDRFEQVSASLRLFQTLGKRDLQVQILPSYGSDIGKPNTDFPDRVTLYPSERHLVVNAHLSSGRSWRGRFFVHPHELTTDVLQDGESSRVENDSFDLGFGVTKAFDSELTHLDGRFGVDYFARKGVDATEVRSDVALPVRSLDDGSVDEGAVFLVLDREIGRTQLEGGVRLSRIEQSNHIADSDLLLAPLLRPGLDRRSEDIWSGFVGVGVELQAGWSLLARVSSGTRVPNLTELFFVGTTGRGTVVGNPGLDKETALDGELGLRITQSRNLLHFSYFRNHIDDYIERVELDPTGAVLGYVNLGRGTIEGVELEGSFRLNSKISFGYGGHWIVGDDGQGQGLADIPAASLRFAPKLSSSRWRASGSVEYRFAKTGSDIGAGESAISEAWLVEAALSRELTDDLDLTLHVSNLLDEVYFPSADEKSQAAVGRTLGFSLRYGF